ncbi:peptidylprolyl isomerase, partial [Enterococcus faecium]|uniref:peptidylprolyl isomerase n=1 Tax=Enterococcus faecium TaxID=1352 RepID=UPI003AB00A32
MKWVAICFICFLIGCKAGDSNTPHIIIETTYGDIELALYANKAPKTVAAFLSFIDSEFYTKASFYRVLNDDNQPSNAPKSALIQGGIWKSNRAKAI